MCAAEGLASHNRSSVNLAAANTDDPFRGWRATAAPSRSLVGAEQVASSRWSGLDETFLAIASRSSVVSPMAETTITT